MVWSVVDSPIGPLTLVGDGQAVTAVRFEDRRSPHPGAAPTGPRDDDDPVLALAATELGEYFARARFAFDLPTAPHGTPFQHRVWTALREIPYGQTATYGDVARRLGLEPSAARAVGLANGANPLAIVVPCHRVIGADGTLTGYGGGLERKQYLLDLERPGLF
jgi:methylated-DNA-[protein]-cysteine S-methyltransferase